MRETIHQYKEAVTKVIESINEKSVGSAVYALKKAREKNQRIFVIGNGGCASNASHFAVDLAIHAVPKNEKSFKVIAITENSPMITAYAAASGYESVFAAQLGGMMEVNDVVFALSINGNEQSILAAVQYAHAKNAYVVALTGKTGGKLRELADVCVHVDCEDLGMICDAHLVICHMLVYWFKENLAPVG